ncbi:hypothetical protein GCM10008959_19490 [Deinococcus seoulensis]|uniref:Secreted protein n=1 Tax=Deinococcus seoulensis TaxID=1837379 RepID=A0ABQ2RTE5_9DEIO|nr:hypothetical protein GCM10008959_19490 [Deinococcus seoulensis]
MVAVVVGMVMMVSGRVVWGVWGVVAQAARRRVVSAVMRGLCMGVSGWSGVVGTGGAVGLWLWVECSGSFDFHFLFMGVCSDSFLF